jgi:hypothetical protein
MGRSRKALAALVLGLGLAALLPAGTIAAERPLDTAIAGSGTFFTQDAGLAFERTRDAGASTVQLSFSWREAAPERPEEPANPNDSVYRWSGLDRAVRLSFAQGLRPFIGIYDAPSWAERGGGGRAGTNLPDPNELGRFAEAAARRYSGSFEGLPRVQLWAAWNEPNASFFLHPQERKGRPVAPAHYRLMLNAFTAGVRRVHPDNDVIAGSLFPFVIKSKTARSIGPLRFMRELLCMSKRLRPRKRCGPPLQFDVWGHHPYTSGGPTHRAGNANSVSIRELPRMRKLLRAADRFKRITHNGPLQFWVTEFSWDSSPPDPNGVPSRLHARWVAEALYRMWRAGVSLVTWFQLRDDAPEGRPHSQVFQSGLYLRCSGGIECDRPKLALNAFRFPFVAFRKGRRVSIWGRTPSGQPASVIVEQAARGGWRPVAQLNTGSSGVFSGRVRAARRGSLRARLAAGGAEALPFSLKVPRDRRVNPFG